MIRVHIYNAPDLPVDDGERFVRDATVLEVEQFTAQAVAEAMHAAHWLVVNGERVVFATAKINHSTYGLLLHVRENVPVTLKVVGASITPKKMLLVEGEPDAL
jgi:hypothetical protein